MGKSKFIGFFAWHIFALHCTIFSTGMYQSGSVGLNARLISSFGTWGALRRAQAKPRGFTYLGNKSNWRMDGNELGKLWTEHGLWLIFMCGWAIWPHWIVTPGIYPLRCLLTKLYDDGQYHEWNDDDDEGDGRRMLARSTRQGMTDLLLFHPECGGSQPTGFPNTIQISFSHKISVSPVIHVPKYPCINV